MAAFILAVSGGKVKAIPVRHIVHYWVLPMPSIFPAVCFGTPLPFAEATLSYAAILHVCKQYAQAKILLTGIAIYANMQKSQKIFNFRYMYHICKKYLYKKI